MRNRTISCTFYIVLFLGNLLYRVLATKSQWRIFIPTYVGPSNSVYLLNSDEVYDFRDFGSIYNKKTSVFFEGGSLKVAQRAAHLIHKGLSGTYGAIILYRNRSFEGFIQKDDVHYTLTNTNVMLVRSMRGILGEQRIASKLLKYSRILKRTHWTNFYAGEETTRYLDLGIATDIRFFEEHGASLDQVLTEIEGTVAKANAIFYAQFNILLRINQLIVTSKIKREIDDTNYVFSTCIPDIMEALEAFQVWVTKLPLEGDESSMPLQQGLWHLFTACYSPPGNVGMAFLQQSMSKMRLGTLCHFRPKALNIGITSKHDPSTTYITFAHEIGHNFGARHSFENGRGKTGGIMDYDVGGIYKGEIQFNDLRKPEICYEINTTLKNEFCSFKSNGKSINFFTAFHSDCKDISSTRACKLDDTSLGECRSGVCTVLKEELLFNGKSVPFKKACQQKKIEDILEGPLVKGVPSNACSPLKNWIGTSGNAYALIMAGGGCSIKDKALYVKLAGFTGAIIVVSENLQDESVNECEGTTYMQSTTPILLISNNDGSMINSILKKGYGVNVAFGPFAGVESSGFILHDPVLSDSEVEKHLQVTKNIILNTFIGALSCVAAVALSLLVYVKVSRDMPALIPSVQAELSSTNRVKPEESTFQHQETKTGALESNKQRGHQPKSEESTFAIHVQAQQSKAQVHGTLHTVQCETRENEDQLQLTNEGAFQSKHGEPENEKAKAPIVKNSDKFEITDAKNGMKTQDNLVKLELKGSTSVSANPNERGN